MKKSVLAVVLFALVFVFTENASAQLKKKDLKAIKAARKEAKSLKKDKWEVAAGALPMEKMLERSWEYQLTESKPGVSTYIWASQNGIGQSHAGAKMQAMELAKVNLAGQISAEIVSLTEASVANQELSREDAATVSKVVQGSKNFVAQSLANVQPVVVMFREVGKKNIEYQVRLFYNKEETMTAAKKKIKKKLEEETDIIHGKLDKMLGLDE